MDINFKSIYKVLKTLEHEIDNEDFDFDSISHKVLKISELRWTRLMQMLIENHYIDGLESIYMMGQSYPSFKDMDIRITLEGLQYLEENSIMTKIKNAVKEIKDFIPGL